MVVMAPRHAPKKDGDIKISSVGQLLYDTIFYSGELRQDYDDVRGTFTKGEMKALPRAEPDDDFIPIRLDHYPAVDWRRKLVIKRDGREFFLESTSNQRKRINYGILMHRILSLVH